jgi:hypothetical protein
MAMASALHSGERNGDLGRVAIRASISDLLVTEKVFLDSGQNFENVSALWQNENPPVSIEDMTFVYIKIRSEFLGLFPYAEFPAEDTGRPLRASHRK